jgi:hypothetical protein
VAEILGAFRRPQRAIDLVLGHHARLARSLAEGRCASLLALLLLVVGVICSLPMGALPPLSAFWKVAALFTGSVLLCFPSLFVFGVYTGSRIGPGQGLALSLLVSAVAGCFALGFAPIVWFIDLTSGEGAFPAIPPKTVALAFLVASLCLALLRLAGCMAGMGRLRELGRTVQVLITAWVALLVLVFYRMTLVLDLL